MMAHKVELELQLASEIDLHPEIPVNTSCQHIEELDEDTRQQIIAALERDNDNRSIN